MPDGRDDFGVDHVAALARLRLTPDERDLYARQLADILAYARRILDLDTSDAKAAPPPPPASAILREDCARPSIERSQALGQSPDRNDDAGLFRVPRVIG